MTFRPNGIRKSTMNRESLLLIAAAIVVVCLVAGGAAWYDGIQHRLPAAGGSEAAEIEALEARLRTLQAKVAATPADPESWRELGRGYMALGRFLEAVEAWSVVAELRPGDREAAAAFARLDDIARSRGRHRDQ